MGLHGVTGLGLRSWEAVKLAVGKGIGIAAISRLALDLEVEAGRIVILDVPRWRLQRTISVRPSAGRAADAAGGGFLQLLRETFVAEQPPPNSNLPALETALVGRGRELAELSQLVRAGALVTLTGPGGSGKTRLAIEVARRLVDDFPDGVFLVDLAPLRDHDLVLAAIADALALKSTDDLDQRLRGRRLLLRPRQLRASRRGGFGGCAPGDHCRRGAAGDEPHSASRTRGMQVPRGATSAR